VDDLLANATLHVRRRCLGVVLRPYSLWHAHVLEALDNPFGVHRACVPAAMVREMDPARIELCMPGRSGGSGEGQGANADAV
jgi:hypothetical protein